MTSPNDGPVKVSASARDRAGGADRLARIRAASGIRLDRRSSVRKRLLPDI